MKNFKINSSKFLIFTIFVCFFPGLVVSSAVVTLESIEIYKRHEWLNSKPTVYFQCKGENRTLLPDVKETHVSYHFKAEESWQPLTELSNTKCKRCGFYEKDTLKPDDVFDEWELCPEDFNAPGKKCTRLVEKELNATFVCQECTLANAAHSGSGSPTNKMHTALVVIISALVLAVFVFGGVIAFKYWQKKRRQQEQARFLKLFEEGDEVEDDLDVGM